MKKAVSMLLLLMVAGTMSAQGPKGPMGKPGDGQPKKAQRKYQIIVENERNAKRIKDTNHRLLRLQDASRSLSQRGLLGDLLWSGYTNAFKQKTVNATSNLLSVGISHLAESLKSKREAWYQRAQQQCYYHQLLSAETQINDFYALPSTNGSMDPANLKFEGFGCKSYIEVMGDGKEGVGVFYVFCKMRRDSIGLSHIVNHSKFMVEIDSLVFNPKYCNLPNDSTGSAENRFSFEKRDHLTLELKARFYSSWMNQATMIANDQLLGEFTVKVNVDKNKLNADGLFVYNKKDSDFVKLVSVDGDCFIVPRSYTGTNDAVNYLPSWGTGQYRIEMEVSERCSIVDSYYQIREAGNGEIVSFTEGTSDESSSNAEKWKWDKAKWKVEWKAMKVRRKGDSFLDNAWNCIVTAYKGNGWMATLTDPLATSLYTWETKKLGGWIDDAYEMIFNEKAPVSNTNNGNSNATKTPSATNATPNGSTQPNNPAGSMPGNAPIGGAKPQ